MAKELEFFDFYLVGHDKKEMILDLCKERANTIVELKSAIESILNVPTVYEVAGVNKFIKENTIEMLNKYCELLSGKDLHIPTDVEDLTKPFISENGLKFPELFQPIRISLTGGTQAPSVYDIIAILGVEETLQRINSAINNNFGR